MHCYAQIRDGVVVAVTQTSGEVVADDMVAVDSLDPTLMGATYVDGEFIRPDPPAA